MSLLKKAAEKAPVINRMIKEFEGDRAKATQIQSFGVELRTFLKENGLLKHERVHHRYCGVAKCNRNYAMLIPLNSPMLLYRMVNKGWSWFEVQLALAAEISPTSTGDSERQENAKLIARSDGLLAPIDADELKIVTIISSHTTSVLRMCDANSVKAVQGWTDEVANEHGVITKERVIEKAPSMQEPIAIGLEYDIIPYQLVDLCPRLLDMLAEADNAKHKNAAADSPLQMMMNIHRRATQEEIWGVWRRVEFGGKSGSGQGG